MMSDVSNVCVFLYPHVLRMPSRPQPHRLADESACLLACRAYLSTRTAAFERLRALSRGAYALSAPLNLICFAN